MCFLLCRGFLKPERSCTESSVGKRYSLAGTSTGEATEPIHMTLQEVRQYLQNLYSSSSDSSDHNRGRSPKVKCSTLNNNKYYESDNMTTKNGTIDGINQQYINNKKNSMLSHLRNKKVKDSCEDINGKSVQPLAKADKRKKAPAKFFSLKQTLCNLFRFKRFSSPEHVKTFNIDTATVNRHTVEVMETEPQKMISNRALPPLPEKVMFTTSITRVKDVRKYKY